MVIGQSSSRLDAKNRIKIPKKILKQIRKDSKSENLFITIGLEKCLFLFTEEGWHERERRMQDVSFNSQEARRYERVFFGSAEEVTPDALGRFIIPDHLRHRIGGEKELVFVGVKNRVEIWGLEEWKAISEENEQNYESFAEKLIT